MVRSPLSPVHLGSPPGSRHGLPDAGRRQVPERSRYERHHVGITAKNGHRQKGGRQRHEVPGTDQLWRIGARVVDAIDRGPVGPNQYLRHAVPGDDEADLMPSARRHDAGVDGELALAPLSGLSQSS